MLFILNKILLI